MNSAVCCRRVLCTTLIGCPFATFCYFVGADDEIWNKSTPVPILLSGPSISYETGHVVVHLYLSLRSSPDARRYLHCVH